MEDGQNNNNGSSPQCADLNNSMINRKMVYKSLRLSEKLNDQLIDLRPKKHREYVNKFNKRIASNTGNVCNNIAVNDITSSKPTNENNSEVNKKYKGNKEKNNNDTITWKHGTCLVVGDSILWHIDETYLPRKFNVKEIPSPGAKISDMYNYLIPTLNKKADYIVLHIGTNDAFDTEAVVLVDKLPQLNT